MTTIKFAAEPADMVTLDHEIGLISVKLIDPLPWDEIHLTDLQSKINHCLQWIESGKIYLHYPEAQGCDFAIDLQCIYGPNATALAFLTRAHEALEEVGYTFSWRPMGSAYAGSDATAT